MEKIVQALAEQEWLSPSIQAIRVLGAKQPTYTAIPEGLHPALVSRLQELGIKNLYAHQADAIVEALAKRDIVVTTGTNSGKTLCYNIPVVQACLTEPMARALYLFPTKALAQDQIGRLEALMSGDIVAGVYDGDTSAAQRAMLRKAGQVILTNPDMLHLGILPRHETWGKFLRGLRVIVIDELHTYRGVFGSHVALVLWRLLRLCEWYGSRPQIIACSGTIGNPAELFAQLTGREGLVIGDDRSPQGRRFLMTLAPDDEGPGPNAMTAELLAELIQSDCRVMAFCRARVTTELVLKQARSALARRGGDPERLDAYRGGYSSKERREIEKKLLKGKLSGLVTTNAMELGVDVGGLDAIIMNGYPGSLASYWQQSGRAGRGWRDSLTAMVAHFDPLEHYLAVEPERLLGRAPETPALNPSNPTIFAQHLRCAAFERAVEPAEMTRIGPTALGTADQMTTASEISFSAGRYFFPSHEGPAANVNLRGSSNEEFKLMVQGDVLGTIEKWRGYRTVHEGAIYIHRGQTYSVERLDEQAGQAWLSLADVDYYTQSQVNGLIEARVTIATHELGEHRVDLVGLSVTNTVTSFRKIQHGSGATIETVPLRLPSQTYDSVGIRVSLGIELEIGNEDEEASEGVAGIVHGLEHALSSVAPLVCGSDREDLGTAWYLLHPDTFAPAVFLYDATPGGIGLSERLFSAWEKLREDALLLLESCSCAEGCPSCLYRSACESANQTLDKAQTIEMLRLLGIR